MKKKIDKIKKYKEFINASYSWMRLFWAGSVTFFIVSIIIASINLNFPLTPSVLLIYGVAATSIIHIVHTQILKCKIKKLSFELEKEKSAKKTLNQNVKKEFILKNKDNNFVKKDNQYLYKNKRLNTSNYNIKTKSKRKILIKK